jgi:2-polyprenyl-3-methyl-5-hydroxy-6-metoxy-1,4-benzoquinol methylase
VRHDILHVIENNPGRVLDIGGGTGATSALIKRRFLADFVAVIDGACVEPEEGVDLFLQGNLDDPAIWDRLAIEQDGFDTILCLDVLEHLVDPWEVVRRCSGLLRVGGRLIVSIPNARNYKLTFPLFFLGKFKLMKNGVLDRTHLRWFVRRSAIELVTCGGLELEYCAGGWYLNRAKWWERLAKYGIAPGFLFQIYYLKAKKMP